MSVIRGFHAKNPLLLTTLLAAIAACGGDRQPEPPVVVGVGYVGIAVSNIEQSATFYTAGAQMAVVGDGVWENSQSLDRLAARETARTRTRMLRTSNAQLRLMQFEHAGQSAADMPVVPVNGPGIAHVCFQADRETGIYQKFSQHGAVPVGAPRLVQLSDRRPVEYAYSRDSDGIMFEVEHVDIPALNLPEPPEHDIRLRHVSIASPDLSRLLEFYSQLLNEPKPRRVGRFFGISGDKVDQVSGLDDASLSMAWFQIGNLELELIQYKSHPTALPERPRPVDAIGYNMIVFDVTDIDAAREALLAAGGSVITEPEVRDGGKRFFGRDVDGNLLGFQVVAANSVASSRHFE